MDTQTLSSVAKSMVAAGKGILAADESHKTCQKRFDSVGIEFTEENRRKYRQTLITAEGLEEFISGIILFDETLRQKADDGTSFVDILNKKNILPGIKVDAGAKPLALHEGEKVTEGLDGLRERLIEYKELGAQFAKWRSVITIGKDIPSQACLEANVHGQARYAALCQEAGIVPIVEPEVLINGEHSIERCYEITTLTLKMLYQQLKVQGVYLPGTVLKASMVIAGKESPEQSSVQDVAEMTVKCLRESVPSEVPGIVFLSGGQGDIQATENLNMMNKLHDDLPWNLSFSYGRALQAPALKLWSEGKSDEAAQALVHRAKMNGLATLGKYGSELENE
ncbi:fructose-bisphosphate aldolase class I [Candidatus Gracilibacteria bacterium]|nr:fructose-bisphosphate aldolase class I [Candidatus Gracilibacteria bacterium]MCF7819275.1 fructose-bisphosphate aldolase class I [Candidatus Gracilibacteria bacterium]